MRAFKELAGGFAFTEAPRWHEGRLIFVDQHGLRVYAVDMDGGLEVLAELPHRPSGLGFLRDGRMLIVSMRDRKVMRREMDGELSVHADLSLLAPFDLNEMVVGADGRAWVGNFGFDLHGGAAVRTAQLVCVDPDGSSRVVADGLGFPNGMVLTPDGHTLIVAESLMSRLSAFDVKDGALGERRTWAAFGPTPASTDSEVILRTAEVVPDGICLDAEGAVWIADVTHRRFIRVAEGGRILDELGTPGTMPFACMLGGEDGRTLFACVAPTFHEAEARANRQSSILMAKVDVPHAGLP